MSEENKKVDEISKENENEFKIAEVWSIDGQLIIKASEYFWSDRPKAVGLFDMCKDIVKSAKTEKPKIITGGNGGIINFARNLGRKKK